MPETDEPTLFDIKRLGGGGVLTIEDIHAFRDGKQRVAELMADGFWHTADEIRRASGAAEGLRRMRELRDIPGVEIERERIPGSNREFRYRLARRRMS